MEDGRWEVCPYPISHIPSSKSYLLFGFAKMTASFLDLEGLILYGGEGLLEVAGAGGAAGGRVCHDSRADGLFRDPS